jgi:putative addiction module killer protein
MIREIITYDNYYDDFIATVSPEVKKKVHYVFDLLCTKEVVSKKFVRHIRDGIYEIKIEYDGNIYRIFFIFDKEKIVVLFNGFQKKTQKTPKSEIQKARKIRKEYYEYKQNQKCQ